MTAQEVAARMLERLETRRELLRVDAIELICQTCGSDFTFVDESGATCIAQPVLRAFKRLHCGRARWEQGSGRWYLPAADDDDQELGIERRRKTV